MDQSKSESACLGREPSDKEIESLLDQLSISHQANLIGVLQEVQRHFGYLPAGALERISRRMRVPLSRIYGVLSFYAQFYTTPRGRHTIRCCRGTACYVRGGRKIIDAVRKTLRIDEGQTTPDMLFTFETVACLGACALSPVVIMDSTYFGKATPRRICDLLKNIAADESPQQETD